MCAKDVQIESKIGRNLLIRFKNDINCREANLVQILDQLLKLNPLYEVTQLPQLGCLRQTAWCIVGATHLILETVYLVLTCFGLNFE